MALRTSRPSGLATSNDGVHWRALNGGRAVVALGHGCDSDTTVFYHCERDSFVLIKRRNVPTPENWRQIRGVEIWTNLDLENASGWRRESSFWLDREGRNDVYRRQLYGLLATPMDGGLYLGVAHCLEFPKRLGARGDQLKLYLATSRDGIDYNLDNIYLGEELVPLRTADDSTTNTIFPANQFLTHGGLHWLFFEAKETPHEDRFASPGRLGVATWRAGRLAALSVSWRSREGVATTKPFHLRSHASLTLNLVLPDPQASCVVELLRDQRLVAESAPLHGPLDSVAALVTWQTKREPFLHGIANARLRFRLRGGAAGSLRLHGIRVTATAAPAAPAAATDGMGDARTGPELVKP